MHNYICLVGQTVNDLRLDTIIRYEHGLPIYSATCLQCHAYGVPVSHKSIKLGIARCVSSTHGKATIVPGSTALLTTRTNVPGASARTHSQPLQAAPDQEAERRKAARLEANRRYDEHVHDQFRRYARHAIATGVELEQLPTLATWRLLADEARRDIMAKIAEEKSDRT